MSPVRSIACATLLLLPVACGLSMNYPVEPETMTPPSGSPGAGDTRVGDSRSANEFGIPEDALPADVAEARPWHELTRLAREDRQAGRLDEARTRLEQAAIQLAERPSSDAGRRAVFDLQARLALDFIAMDRAEDANAMAEGLFEQAEQEPELASSALVDLAYETASRSDAPSEGSEAPSSQLRLLRLALGAAEQGPASRRRMLMAADIALTALEQGDLVLARRGIDRAVLDARTVAPTDRTQLGSLKIYKARIARAQGDFETAEASAVSAEQIFQEGRSGPANLVVADATLARILAEKGEIDRARDRADSASRRANGDPPMADFVKRIALGAQARVERGAGDPAAARARYRQALALPAAGFAVDEALIAELTAELATLDAPETVDPPEPAEPMDAPPIDPAAQEAPPSGSGAGPADPTSAGEASR